MPKCKDCCFVGFRDRYTNELKELTPTDRQTGLAVQSDGRRGMFQMECGIQKRDFPPNNLRPQDAIALLDEEIACDRHSPIKPGRSPQEAEQMDFRDMIFQWKQEQALQNEKFAMRLQALEETRHQENRSDTSKHFYIATTISVVALLLSLLGILLSFVK